MLNRIKPYWEFLEGPRNWTNANIALGVAILLIVKEGDKIAESFALGWVISAFVGSLPALFSKAWDFRSQVVVKADRSLAYIEGWCYHRKSMEFFIDEAEAGKQLSEDESINCAHAIFLDGLNRVETGKHLPNA